MKFNLALNDVEKLLQDYYQKTIDSKAKIQIDVRKNNMASAIVIGWQTHVLL